MMLSCWRAEGGKLKGFERGSNGVGEWARACMGARYSGELVLGNFNELRKKGRDMLQ